MRPVLLELDGFGSFRAPTSVDFSGAEYFALVGPTGAGKSTIIDALTFALYGSVPRWDNARTVALALAPTSLRGAVKLVFDIGGARYVVARELRRNPSTDRVSVRNARLEKLVDARARGGPEDATEPLADGASDVTAAVEDLLGLPFGDFTTCVVLPQGDFAEFLHTEPRKRQEKLVRILGLGVYDRIAKEANTEAAAQKQRAEVLAEQLDAYADATPEAAASAADRTAALRELATRTTADVTELAGATAALAVARTDIARIRDEADRLSALAQPDGLADLDERRRVAADRRTAAAAAAALAEEADTAARDALAAAPARGPLERARQAHADRTRLTADLPGLREEHVKAAAAYDTAAAEAAAARDALTAAREARTVAVTAAQEARDAVTRLTRERDGLRALEIPEGLDALDRRRAAAAEGLDRATTALAAAEAAETAARDALAAAPDRAPLQQARRDHTRLGALHEEHAEVASRLVAAEDAVDSTARSVADAVHTLEHARTRRAAAQRADLAAALRPDLVVGEPCPVCAQAVATVPAPTGDAGAAEQLAAAEEAVSAAESAAERAATASARAVAARDAGEAAAERVVAEIDRLHSDLAAMPGAEWVRGRSRAAATGVDAGARAGADGPGSEPARPDLAAAAAGMAPAELVGVAEIEAGLAEIDRLAEAVTTADRGLRTARRARDDATAAGDALRRDEAAAVIALREARDPLVPFGAPAVESADGVLAGWTALVEWAHAEATSRDRRLPEVREAVTTTVAAYESTEQALELAGRAEADRRREETAATRAEQQTRGAVATAQDRLAELERELRNAPSDDDAAATLEHLDTLDQALWKADAAVRERRTAQRAAEAAAAEVEREVTMAWNALRHARDPLVPLGAPAVTGEHLPEAWAELLEWARAAATDRERLVDDATARAGEALAARDGAFRRIAAGLAEHGLTVPGLPAEHLRAAAAESRAAGGGGPAPAAGVDLPPVTDAHAATLASAAPSVVAGAVERARSAEEHLGQRRGIAEKIAADRTAAEEARDVAKMLGTVLRSDGFPRWLVASALDALVADASRSLSDLSGGQFELTHEDGDFLVVDHTDADTRRPVKTLSGGETFQASLALALALSAQMSGLAAHGAPRLESIFLDEGFGTLDEANLDVVASTLENLAARGDRMVGVITHVPALADRVPVRFSVRRDQRTSSVSREDR